MVHLRLKSTIPATPLEDSRALKGIGGGEVNFKKEKVKNIVGEVIFFQGRFLLGGVSVILF